MALVINMIPFDLPSKPGKLTFTERRKRDDLERRSSLASRDLKNSLDPLTEAEEKEYLAYQVQRKIEASPMAAGIELQFAKLGAKGCVRELAYPMANVLARNWRIRFRGQVTHILRILSTEEKPEAAIKEAVEEWNVEHAEAKVAAEAGAEVPTPQTRVTAPRDDPRYRQERSTQGAAAGTFFNRQVEGPRVRA